jgi:hypothetical protein
MTRLPGKVQERRLESEWAEAGSGLGSDYMSARGGKMQSDGKPQNHEERSDALTRR